METEGLEKVVAAVAAEQGEEGKMWVGYEDRFFFFFFTASSASNQQDGESRTSRFFFC